MSNSDDEGTWFSIEPKTDCPHLTTEFVATFDDTELRELVTKAYTTRQCQDCDHTVENWICLKCFNIGCSRYVHSHGLSHATSSGHHVCFSFADLSFWCHECASYIASPRLFPATAALHLARFNEPHPKENKRRNTGEDPTSTIASFQKTFQLANKVVFVDSTGIEPDLNDLAKLFETDKKAYWEQIVAWYDLTLAQSARDTQHLCNLVTSKVQENESHTILTKAKEDCEVAVVTSSIDGAYGLTHNVVNIQGSIFNLKCVDCAHVFPLVDQLDTIKQKFEATCPQCSRQHVRSQVLQSGDQLDNAVIDQLVSAFAKTDFVIIFNGTGKNEAIAPAYQTLKPDVKVMEFMRKGVRSTVTQGMSIVGPFEETLTEMFGFNKKAQ